MIFISLIDYVKLRNKILILSFFFNFFSHDKFIRLSQNIDILTNFIEKIKTKDDRAKFLDNSLYIKLYKSGIYVFKNNPWLGVGNKNYRLKHAIKIKIRQQRILLLNTSSSSLCRNVI